jgi:hypothetical protein
MPDDNVVPFIDRRPLSLAQQCRRAARALETARLAHVEAECARGEATKQRARPRQAQPGPCPR